ncbi:Uncharacterised protein [Enterobacter hormaechei]|nr:Uncharacterised protein [Enterobacter hormaechei]CZU34961.1 Uncharacterised protein [Enterobacter hormaechei]CZU85754.1 Uncharacterised protein [Enterobacter hormaechei]CZV12128.1 Uncharacterised protein [Enterobacter hormaechei]CZX97495.1 Uncharacterised protein [Enterobacter hormaechei]
MRHDNAAQRTRQIPGSENAEGLYLTQPFRNIRREKQRPHDGGEEDKDDEVVKLQRAAQGSEREGFVVLAIQRSGVM